MDQLLTTLAHMDLTSFLPIVYTAFGFFLGLCGTLFLQRLERRTQTNEFIAILRVQLKEALPRLVGMRALLADLLGQTDRGVYEWLRLKHQYFEVEEEVDFDEILRLTDEQIASLHPPTTETKAFHKIYLPVLESHIPSFNWLEPEAQSILLNLRTQINWTNSWIERDWFYFKKTFDSSLDETNHEIILANQRDGYNNLSETSRRAADLITDALEALPPDIRA